MWELKISHICCQSSAIFIYTASYLWGIFYPLGHLNLVYQLSICRSSISIWASKVALPVKNPPANTGHPRNAGSILGSGYPMEESMATQSSILAWRIPWTEEPGRLQSIGSQRHTTEQLSMHTCGEDLRIYTTASWCCRTLLFKIFLFFG